MPLIATRGAASAQGFGEFLQQSAATYIEDVFSTYLYTGNGSTQTITNGIDLSTKGGLVWMKGRSGATDHALYDTARGTTKDLVSNSSAAETTQSTGLTSFGSTGFSIGALAKLNTNAATYVSWTFRKQPKFFDVVTWTGNSVVGRQIPHSLGSVPGCIIVKSTNSADPWWVYHRSTGNTGVMILNTTDAFTSPLPNAWNNTDPTATVFTVGSAGQVNQTGQTYVAYLFAHDAGGFGLTGSDNVISCGSFTTDTPGNATVNLGYEPQWILTKPVASGYGWNIADTMRGMSQTSVTMLAPDTNAADNTSSGAPYLTPTATGFSTTAYWSSQTLIYIAIRRGPMKVPTSATTVFTPIAYSANNTAQRLISTGGITDSVWARSRGQTSATTSYVSYLVGDRLRGSYFWGTASSGAEVDASGQTYPSNAWSNMDGFRVSNNSTANINYTGTQIAYAFKRAPNFFDVVCWWGESSSSQQVSHNLNATPELIITKPRDTLKASSCWALSNVGQTLLSLTGTNAGSGGYTNQHTSTYFKPYYVAAFSLGDNNSAGNYVSYLFGSCPGVSKVGSYTGTGALQTVNCGFTGGARFVLIKRIDSTGDWYAYDSARGISSSNDPYLLLNTRVAEVTTTNYVDTDSTGFQVTAAAPAGLNANGGTYIFLAIA